MDLNNITIVGRLAKEPEQVDHHKYDIAKGVIAVNSAKKDAPAYFFDFTAFGNSCNVIMSLKKGDKLGITGYLTQDKWQNDAGENLQKVLITVNKAYQV